MPFPASLSRDLETGSFLRESERGASTSVNVGGNRGNSVPGSRFWAASSLRRCGRRQAPGADRMRVAVAGCCHGELDKIYETLAVAERRGPGPVDLLLCCGDFQAVRNEADLRCMAVPPKYRHMQTFYR